MLMLAVMVVLTVAVLRRPRGKQVSLTREIQT